MATNEINNTTLTSNVDNKCKPDITILNAENNAGNSDKDVNHSKPNEKVENILNDKATAIPSSLSIPSNDTNVEKSMCVTTTPTIVTESPLDYEQFVAYNEKGIAIYTDPITKCQFEFSNEENKWLPLTSHASEMNCNTEQSAEKSAEKGAEKSAGKSAEKGAEKSAEQSTENPYENEHYRWCDKTNQWIPKVLNDEQLENEFYKWDFNLNKWVAKNKTSDTTTTTTVLGDNVKTYTDSDGMVYFWDDEKCAWFPKIDDEFMANYQLSYGFIDNNDSVKSDQKDIVKVSNSDKCADMVHKMDENDVKKMSNKRKQPEWFDLPNETNTKVYVDNLPDDITEEEFIDLMSKCGMILKDQTNGKHKIKLYAESNGQLKGDGLCHYIRVESVQLALNLLDGSDYRGRKLKVQRAQFQMRGNYNPALKPKRRKGDKEKMKKMQDKLLDWRPEKMRGERSKHERIVIIKNLFTPDLFEKEVHLIIDYQKDLREECSKCGTVRKVIIYDRHADGVAQINMADPEEADLVVQMMHKRFFGQRQLIAEIWDGKTKYKVDETGAEQDKRLSNWEQFLDDGETKIKSENIKITCNENVSE